MSSIVVIDFVAMRIATSAQPTAVALTLLIRIVTSAQPTAVALTLLIRGGGQLSRDPT